ncbi:30S ribosomal protein S4 [Candidatus Altiarchaeota archaeon]
MGEPRKQRKKYSRPPHPWKAERIAKEGEIQKEYGLKNKREIWKAKSDIDGYRQTARRVLASPTEDSKKEGQKLLEKLNRLGVLESDKIEDILSLEVESLLERRVQTVVYRQGLCSTIKQARQLVVHRHVLFEDRVINTPRFIIPRGEEEKVKISGDIKIEHGQKRRTETKEEAAG